MKIRDPKQEVVFTIHKLNNLDYITDTKEYKNYIHTLEEEHINEFEFYDNINYFISQIEKKYEYDLKNEYKITDEYLNAIYDILSERTAINKTDRLDKFETYYYNKYIKTEEKLTNTQTQFTSKEDLLKALQNKPPKEEKKTITIQLPVNIINQLKTYSDVYNSTQVNTVRKILIEHFDTYKVTRDYYKPEKTQKILIPTNYNLYHEYIENKFNLNVSTRIEEGIEVVTPHNNQYTIYNDNKDYFNIIEVRVINNLLDEYNKTYHCFSSSRSLINKESEIIKDFKLNHLGLLILDIDNFSYFDDESKKEMPVGNIFVLVQSYNNTIVATRIVSKEEILELAKDVHNNDVSNYVKNYDDVLKLKKVDNEFNNYNKLVYENEYLTDKIKTLETELEKVSHINNNLKNKKTIDIDLETYNKTIKENKDLKLQLDKMKKQNKKDYKTITEIEKFLSEILKTSADN